MLTLTSVMISSNVISVGENGQILPSYKSHINVFAYFVRLRNLPKSMCEECLWNDKIGVSEIKWLPFRKKSMARYFDHNCSKQDKSFWRTISPFFSDKKLQNGNHIILRENDNTIVDSGEIAEVFNEYFSSVASEICFPDSHSCASEAISAHQNHLSVIKIRDSYDDIHGSFDFRPVNHCEISRKLKMLNIRKSTGYDNIPAKLLRMAYVELASPISKLINNAMQMNVFPETMKCAELSPIYKKDDNLLKNNFRPVSVLTGIAKLYESVVNDQLLEFFCKLFNDLICAFRKGITASHL